MSHNHFDIAKKIIEENKIMTIATTDGKLPWSTPVIYVWDGGRKFYFLSRANTRHSTNIQKNCSIACSIHPDYTRPLIGIQMEGKTKSLSGKDALKTMKIYLEKIKKAKGKIPVKEILKIKGQIKFFEFEAEKMFVLSENHFGWGKRVEVNFGRVLVVEDFNGQES